MDDDAPLISGVRKGDPAAFEALVRRYLDRVAGVAARCLGGDRHEALDVAQEVFVEAWSMLPGWREGGSLFSWLYRTTLNLCSKRLRKRRRIVLSGAQAPETPSAPPPDDLARADHADALRMALDGLTAQQREVFLLRHEEGLPLDRIAARLGVAVGTVKSHLHRALTALRETLPKP